MTEVKTANYDYLLGAGPGRSGTDLVYNYLRLHPNIEFPEIKEGEYYKRPRAYRSVRASIEHDKILADLDNLAYLEGTNLINQLENNLEGERILLVFFLRDHYQRAQSSIQFMRSRGLDIFMVRDLLKLRKPRSYEQVALDIALHPETFNYILLTSKCDVAIIHFDLLIKYPRETIQELLSILGLESIDLPDLGNVNESVVRKNFLLSAVLKLGAIALRNLGLRSVLRSFKENDSMKKLVYSPLTSSNSPPPKFSIEQIRNLDSQYEDCLRIMETLPIYRDYISFRPGKNTSDDNAVNEEG